MTLVGAVIVLAGYTLVWTGVMLARRGGTDLSADLIRSLAVPGRPDPPPATP